MEEATHQTSVKKIFNIQEQFDKSAKVINEKINAWYQRYAENNNMSMLDAKKSLNAKELKELKWDVEEYIKKGKENAFSGEWVKELENASARAHISRLEALELQCRQQAEVAFGNLNDEVSKHIKDVYKESYYRTAYEIQKGVGVGSNFAALNDRLIEKVVNKPWLADGKNFSDRIWGNKTQLINQLHTSLSQMCITGAGPDKAISQIASKMNVSKVNAGRLVMTESAYFSSAAQKECFKELDVEKYEIVATLDGHTSDICQEMDGKVFKMSEYEEGVTAPPFHVNCRSCTAPYFDDEWGGKGERAARNEDGDTYYVPADMTYGEWKESLKNNDKFYEAEKISNKIKKLQVKWNNIDNPEYKRKFLNITSSEEVNNKLYEKARDILKHRDGTDYEDFYLIDMQNGEVKASQTKVEYMPNVEEELKHNRVWYNKEIKREIKNNPPKTFITIHNHSHNMPPSGGDFKGAFNNNYYAGITIGYNGDIYYYKVGKKKFTEKMYDLTVAKYRNRGYNEIEAYEATLNQFVKEYGIEWRKL